MGPILRISFGVVVCNKRMIATGLRSVCMHYTASQEISNVCPRISSTRSWDEHSCNFVPNLDLRIWHSYFIFIFWALSISWQKRSNRNSNNFCGMHNCCACAILVQHTLVYTRQLTQSCFQIGALCGLFTGPFYGQNGLNSNSLCSESYYAYNFHKC